LAEPKVKDIVKSAVVAEVAITGIAKEEGTTVAMTVEPMTGILYTTVDRLARTPVYTGRNETPLTTRLTYEWKFEPTGCPR